MSFQVRPNSFTNISSENNIMGASRWKNNQHTRASNIPIDEFNEYEIDEFNENDAEITTPYSVRERGVSFTASQAVSSKSGTSVSAQHRNISDGPTTPIRTRDSGSSPFHLSTTDKHTSAGSARAQSGDSPQGSVKLKLISDENELSPEAVVRNALSPPRNSLSRFSDSLDNQDNDMEFDPSDRDSPEKRNGTGYMGNAETIPNKEANQNLRKQTAGTLRKTSTLPEIPKVAAAAANEASTPKKSSPLRNEVLLSSSVKSTASNMLDEIRKSGALQPRTSEEIEDQIHSSMLRLEQSSSGIGSASESSSPESSDIGDDSEDEELLNKLDHFISKDPNGVIDQDANSKAFEADERERNVFQSPESKKASESTSFSKLSRVDLARLQNTGSPAVPKKENRTRRFGKLSGKYARKKITDSKQKTTTKKFADWSAEQWGKLKNLVESDVPNHIISSSPLVMKELKCGSKQELALRVRFLEKTNK